MTNPNRFRVVDFYVEEGLTEALVANKGLPNGQVFRFGAYLLLRDGNTVNSLIAKKEDGKLFPIHKVDFSVVDKTTVLGVIQLMLKGVYDSCLGSIASIEASSEEWIEIK